MASQLEVSPSLGVGGGKDAGARTSSFLLFCFATSGTKSALGIRGLMWSTATYSIQTFP